MHHMLTRRLSHCTASVRRAHLVRRPIWLSFQVPNIQLWLVGVCHHYVGMLGYLPDLVHLNISTSNWDAWSTLQCSCCLHMESIEDV